MARAWHGLDPCSLFGLFGLPDQRHARNTCWCSLPPSGLTFRPASQKRARPPRSGPLGSYGVGSRLSRGVWWYDLRSLIIYELQRLACVRCQPFRLPQPAVVAPAGW
eukprot:gene17956-biopygen9913